MKALLDVKKRCSFSWLWAIRNARIGKCCTECFIGDKHYEAYGRIRSIDNAFTEFNKHVIFVSCESNSITACNDKIQLIVTDARQIDSQGNEAGSKGEFIHKQDTFRNWVLADHISNRQPL